MKRNILNTLAVFVLLLSLAGCATAGRQRAYLREVGSLGVDAAVYTRLKKSRDLSLGNIEHLVHKGVPDETIRFFLGRTDTVYSLKTGEIDLLRKADVSDGLIDYLLATSNQYECNYGYGYGHHSFGHGFHHYGHRSHRYY